MCIRDRMVSVGQQPANDLAGGIVGVSHEVERLLQVQRVEQQDHLVQQGSVVAVGKHRAFVDATGKGKANTLDRAWVSTATAWQEWPKIYSGLVFESDS